MVAVLRTLARRLRNVLAECNYAQRRLAVLQACPDAGTFHTDRAPDTYEAFLYRTSGPLAHEPSARQRSAGRMVS
jgi:hypothetical protein